MTKKRQGADIRAQSKRQANAFWKLLRANKLDGGRVDKSQRKLSEQYKQHTNGYLRLDAIREYFKIVLHRRLAAETGASTSKVTWV